MVETIYLTVLVSLLAGFLIWKKVPQPIAVVLWSSTILVFIVCFGISLEIFDRFADEYEDGIGPFLPPVIPSFIFLPWFLRRFKRQHKI